MGRGKESSLPFGERVRVRGDLIKVLTNLVRQKNKVGFKHYIFNFSKILGISRKVLAICAPALAAPTP